MMSYKNSGGEEKKEEGDGPRKPVPTPLPGVPGGQKVPFFWAVFGGTFGHPPQNFS